MPIAGPALMRTSALVEAHYSSVVAREEITVQQSRILVSVRRRPANMVAIGAEFGLGKTTMTGIIGRMEALGLVVRAADPADRRRLVVSATPQGVELADRVIEQVRGAVVDLLSAVSEQDRAELARILTTVLERSRETRSGGAA